MIHVCLVHMVGMTCCLGSSMRFVLFILFAGLWFALCTGVMLLVVLVVTLCVYATLYVTSCCRLECVCVCGHAFEPSHVSSL